MTRHLRGAALPPGVYGYDDLAIGDWIDTGSAQVTAELIDQFATVSGDRYALHMDAAFAAEKGFDDRVAHGLLVLSMVDGLKTTPLRGWTVWSLWDGTGGLRHRFSPGIRYMQS